MPVPPFSMSESLRPASCFTQPPALPQTLPARRKIHRSSKLHILCPGSFDYLDSFPYPVPSVSRGSRREVLMETQNKTSNIPKDAGLACFFSPSCAPSYAHNSFHNSFYYLSVHQVFWHKDHLPHHQVLALCLLCRCPTSQDIPSTAARLQHAMPTLGGNCIWQLCIGAPNRIRSCRMVILGDRTIDKDSHASSVFQAR